MVQCVDVVLEVLDAHRIPRAAFAGHSFGTFYLSRLQRRAPGRAACMAFIDPGALTRVD
jgi:pimeloyl-ACP methyl ester carboxylesterase